MRFPRGTTPPETAIPKQASQRCSLFTAPCCSEQLPHPKSHLLLPFSLQHLPKSGRGLWVKPHKRLIADLSDAVILKLMEVKNKERLTLMDARVRLWLGSLPLKKKRR